MLLKRTWQRFVQEPSLIWKSTQMMPFSNTFSTQGQPVAPHSLPGIGRWCWKKDIQQFPLLPDCSYYNLAISDQAGLHVCNAQADTWFWAVVLSCKDLTDLRSELGGHWGQQHANPSALEKLKDTWASPEQDTAAGKSSCQCYPKISALIKPAKPCDARRKAAAAVHRKDNRNWKRLQLRLIPPKS